MKRGSFFDFLRRYADFPVAVGILGILLVILVPLPPSFVDSLLILNLTFSLLILLATAFVRKPLELSVFPSLLLVVTFYRLALNIATTRLILGNAAEGPLAAGRVVETFGGLVAGANVVVGLTVFTVIVVVQFVVITKGAGRVSEVAARFQLDSMPGKQLSVDGDLAGGLIDQRTARRRRLEISEEADFYGAMDGASKFVRGDAVAGMLIIFVNLVGGVAIGSLYHGMGFAEAAQVFSRLTIGDGLVSQVPALMVSVAAALLVTRSSASEHLGKDLGRQVLSNDNVLFVAATFLLLLLPSGLPVAALLIAAAACLGCGIALRRERLGQLSVTPPPPRPKARSRQPSPDARSLLKVEPLEVEFGYRLLQLIDESRGGDFLKRLARIREQLALELGLVVPAVRVRDSRQLDADEYSVKLRGNRLGRWRIKPAGVVAVASRSEVAPLDAPAAFDPRGRRVYWVDEAQTDEAIEAGYDLLRPAEFLADHLETTIRTHAPEFLTREEVSRLLKDLRERCPTLVNELIPAALKLSDLQKVLQRLLEEGVSIRDLETILEALGNESARTAPLELQVEMARRALGRTVCADVVGSDGKLRAVVLEPALEEFLQGSLANGGEGTVLAVDPQTADSVCERTCISVESARRADRAPVLLCAPEVRPHLARWMGSRRPRTTVLSYKEVLDGIEVEVVGSVSLSPNRSTVETKEEVSSER